MALLIASFRNTHTRTLPVAHATALQRHLVLNLGNETGRVYSAGTRS